MVILYAGNNIPGIDRRLELSDASGNTPKNTKKLDVEKHKRTNCIII